MFGVNFLHGDFYLGFKLAMNLGGLLLLAGIALALYRRMVSRPAIQESSADDALILVWLAVLVVQGREPVEPAAPAVASTQGSE